MYVRKQHAGASSHGFEWPQDGSVVEVPDHIGGDLLTHAPREFSDVTEEHPAWLARQAANEPDAEADTGHPGDEADEAGPAGDAEADGPAGDGNADTSADAALEKPKRKYTRRTPPAE